MKIVLWTDSHFGVRNNSMGWFRSQVAFVENQLMPYLDKLSENEEVILIHLGDVFDSRSSINTYIAQEVKELFERLTKQVMAFYVLQGNHDGFSPVDRKYNTLELVLGSIPDENFYLIDRMTVLPLPCAPPCATEDGAVLLPWFDQELESPEEFTKRYKGHVIFTHADIIMGNPKLKTPVFSGHVHIPYINGNVRNLGSCYSLDFHDANANRFFYVWDPEDDSLQRIANEHSIRFWRMYNEDILDKDWSKINGHDYIEVYIKYSLLQDDEFQAKCDWIRKNFKYSWIIPMPEEMDTEMVDIDCDIASIIEHSIPDDLRERFEIVKAKVQTNGTE